MTSSARPPARSWPEQATRLAAGDLRIDLPNRRIERPDGVHHELPQRVFDLLLVFLAEPGVVHSRDSLFERVWQGVVVEDANLTQGVWMLRRAFGEERRHWFRTVAKTGYAFEPPGPIQVEGNASEPTAPAAPTPPTDDGLDPQARTATQDAAEGWTEPTVRRHIAGTATGIAAVLLAFVTLALPVLPIPWRGDAPTDIAHAQSARKLAPSLRIHLDVESSRVDAHMPDDLWAAVLADAWLGYKLQLLPETLLMPTTQPKGAQLADDERRITIRASRDPRSQDGIVLQARIHDALDVEPPVLSVRGDAKDAVPLADALTQKVLAQLLPMHARAPWPALPRDADAARRYALAEQAARRREWQAAEREAEAAVKSAPDFGPARWLQAQLHARRGDAPGAIELATEARRASTPLSDDAERVLEALALHLHPARHEDAVERLAALEKDWPGRADFAVLRGYHLVRIGRPAEALAALDQPASTLHLLPVEIRIRHAIASSEAVAMNGDPAASRRHAQAALALAATPGMDRERGAARIMLARAHHATPGNAPAPELFDLAASAFDAGGDAPNALYARFLADDIRLGNRAGDSMHLEPLVEQARRLNNVGLEIEALRTTAYRFHRAGEHARFREYLRRAQDTANRSNDLYSQRTLDLDLMGEDFFMANTSSARARVRRLRAGGLDGAIGFLVPLFDGTMTLHEGHYLEALEVLRDGDAPGRQKPPAVVEANYACVRADILLAMMDTVAARPQIDRCRNLGNPTLRAVSRMLDVQADLADGDRESARIKLEGIEGELANLATGVERGSLAGGIGHALAATGDHARAERLLEREIATSQDAGYPLVLAGIETSLAEVAAARGNWPRSRALVLSARRKLPRDIWLLEQRLDRLDIVDALVHGEAPSAHARMRSLRARAESLDDRMALRDLRILASIATNGARGAASPDSSTVLDPSQVCIDWLYSRLPSQRATSSTSR